MKKLIVCCLLLIITGMFLNRIIIQYNNEEAHKNFILSVSNSSNSQIKLFSLNLYLLYIQKLLEENDAVLDNDFFVQNEKRILQADMNLYGYKYEFLDPEVYVTLKTYLLSLKKDHLESVEEITVLIDEIFYNNDYIHHQFMAEKDIFYLKLYLDDNYKQKFIIKDLYSKDNKTFMQSFIESSHVINTVLERKYDNFMAAGIKASILANLSAKGKENLYLFIKNNGNEAVNIYEAMKYVDKHIRIKELLSFNHQDNQTRMTFFIPVFKSEDYKKIITKIFCSDHKL